MHLDIQSQIIVVQEAITDCIARADPDAMRNRKESKHHKNEDGSPVLEPPNGMANLPDVVALCVVAGIERTLAYKIIERWNNQCWRRIGASIGYITKDR